MPTRRRRQQRKLNIMSVEDHFTAAYKKGTPPWDIGKPDFNLVQTVTTVPIAPCKALEIGCGTGDNAIWLAQQGFQVIGIDSSDIAIAKARKKAANSKVKPKFAVLNILKSRVAEGPFGFVFDRGCFHTVDSASERKMFAEQVHHYLGENGVWLSLIGNADEQLLTEGPPRRTAKDIAGAVEPSFEILSLISSHFELHLVAPKRAWVCLMRKRKKSERDA
jgi:methyl halide transferase